MSRPDLELEMLSAACAMPATAVRQLREWGMPAAALARLFGAGELGWGRVSEREGVWEPDPDGAARLLVGVRGADGALWDIAALASADRDDWSLRTGDGFLLGLDTLEEARWRIDRRAAMEQRPKREVVRLFGRPLDWLVAGGEGICVLDWNALALAELRSLPGLVTLTADSAQAAKVLAEQLAYSGLPKVVGAEERMAA